jgi:hypothetical protein
LPSLMNVSIKQVLKTTLARLIQFAYGYQLQSRYRPVLTKVCITHQYRYTKILGFRTISNQPNTVQLRQTFESPHNPSCCSPRSCSVHDPGWSPLFFSSRQQRLTGRTCSTLRRVRHGFSPGRRPFPWPSSGLLCRQKVV